MARLLSDNNFKDFLENFPGIRAAHAAEKAARSVENGAAAEKEEEEADAPLSPRACAEAYLNAENRKKFKMALRGAKLSPGKAKLVAAVMQDPEHGNDVFEHVSNIEKTVAEEKNAAAAEKKAAPLEKKAVIQKVTVPVEAVPVAEKIAFVVESSAEVASTEVAAGDLGDNELKLKVIYLETLKDLDNNMTSYTNRAIASTHTRSEMVEAAMGIKRKSKLDEFREKLLALRELKDLFDNNTLTAGEFSLAKQDILNMKSF